MVQWQGSLFATGAPEIDRWAPTERIPLDTTSWVDVTRGWLRGADDVCQHLVGTVAWRQGRRTMWDRELDDPRLSRWLHQGEDVPHPALADAAEALAERYGKAFGRPGLNFYRDGRDSVAFHRDRELRRLESTMVAVLTLGARRPFLIRPHGGGRSRNLAPASGDLMVMGGRCQLDWEHGVPKVAVAGARISVSWRWTGRDGALNLPFDAGVRSRPSPRPDSPPGSHPA